eukprot:TRINITY_DN23015_c0_g1_i1.p1 TRINITY_DN23015_c0_g1~~TRINITY_DN23015_c0_g1_i1.p1  ORF type:complete len:479 (+),score=115.42 TRINITY_DN23015_c0_g1_i1:146-1582(+)
MQPTPPHAAGAAAAASDCAGESGGGASTAAPLLQVQRSANKCRDLFNALSQEMATLRDHLDGFDTSITEREEELRRKLDRYEREKAAMQRITSFQSNTVKLNVGGTHFDTSLQTLLSQPDSMLAAMFSGRYQIQTDDQQRYFIDRDGKYFDIILNFLRDGSVGPIPDEHVRDRVIREARFYTLEPLLELLLQSPRDGAATAAPFCWDCFSPQVLTDSSFMTVSTTSTTWVHAWSSLEISEGVHYWEVKIDTYDTKNSLNVAIGVTREQLKVACIMGYSYNPDAWAYVCGTGRTSHNKSYSIEYAEPCGEGDVVGVKLDCAARSLEFYKNGRSMGAAFTNVEPPVFPAVSLVHKQQVTLQFPADPPAGVPGWGARRMHCQGSYNMPASNMPASSLAPPPRDRVTAGPGMHPHALTPGAPGGSSHAAAGGEPHSPGPGMDAAPAPAVTGLPLAGLPGQVHPAPAGGSAAVAAHGMGAAPS